MNRFLYKFFTLLSFLLSGYLWTNAQATNNARHISDSLVKADSLALVVKDSTFVPADSLKSDTLKTTDSSAAPADTTKRKKVKEPFERQGRVMLDISHPIGSFINPGQYSYEAYFDYNFWKEGFLVVEAGYGGGKINYENLKYKSANAFLRIGVDKSMFTPIYKGDWDMVTVGARYGIGIGQRGDATFIVPNPFGGTTESSVAAKNFISHWFEITLGLRFELFPRVYTGWNARIRFNFTPDIFQGQVSPNFLSGFGQGDQATSFGFNYYIGYALRWQKKSKSPQPVSQEATTNK